MAGWRIVAALLSILASGAAAAAEIEVLSAGAVEPGLVAAADAFRKQGGDEVKIKFATAPALRSRVGSGEAADVVVATPAVIDEFAKAAKVDAQGCAELGKVGVGVAVRAGAPSPDVSNTEALKRSLFDAESVVFNEASTGLYVEKLLQRLGVWDQVKPKTTRYPDGAAVMEHLIKGQGRELGFGATTEILLYRDKGLRLVGPLPADVQNYTTYVAAPMIGAPHAESARAFVRFLGSPAAKSLFVANGIE